MKIYLQSFFSAHKEGKQLSVARWQPKGFDYLTVDFLVPRGVDGRDIKNLSPEEYLVEYSKVLYRNGNKVVGFLNKMKEKGIDECSFCCWCNTNRQDGYDKLFCHTILIGYLIEKVCPDIEVIYLDGRDMTVWGREEFYSVMKRLCGN